MHRILIYPVLAFSVTLMSGCESFYQVADYIPESASRLSLMYRPDIQQGNVVTQDMVNQLKPGMSKRQVNYLLGTPILVDSFHQDRWDYIYTLKENRKDMEQRDLTLYFSDDQLVRIEGHFRPVPVDEMELANRKETVVDVPDYEPEEKGIVTRTLEAVGIQPVDE